MNKKAFLGFEEGSKGLLVLLALIIILVLIGVKWFPKVKDAFFGSLPSISPDKKLPEATSQQRVPAEVEKYFDNLVTKIKNSLSYDKCLIDIGQMPNMRDNSIILYPPNEIQLKKISARGLTPAEKTEYAEITPCILSGESIVHFQKCYKDNDENSCEKISFFTSQVIIGQSGYSNMLLKSGKNICAIKLYSDWFGNCNEPSQSGMDSDCMEEIKSKNKLKKCGE